MCPRNQPAVLSQRLGASSGSVALGKHKGVAAGMRSQLRSLLWDVRGAHPHDHHRDLCPRALYSP